jgi:hypothetical protein
MRFRAEDRIVDAHQWWKNGDHPDDESEVLVSTLDGTEFLSEGNVVRRFRHPEFPGAELHRDCGSAWDNHGWIDAPDLPVCPGDWIGSVLDGDAVAYIVRKDIGDLDGLGEFETVKVTSCRDCDYINYGEEHTGTSHTPGDHVVDEYEVTTG